MSNITKSKKGSITKNIIIGALIGGGIGAAISLLGSIGILSITASGMATLVILGALMGVVVAILMALSSRDNTAEDKSYDNNEEPLRKAFRNIGDNARIQLRKEQLEISKELVHTADVASHKEVVTEEKTITVPVTHEELVIEKKDLNDSTSDTGGEYSEIMRIPLTEEQIEVVKHPVKLEDVSIYTNQYQETEHVEETIKKETARIETSGNVKVVDQDTEENL